MKKLIIALIVIASLALIVGGIAIFTRPDEQAHKDCMKMYDIGKSSQLIEDSGVPNPFGLLNLVPSLASKLGEKYIDKHFTFEKHLFYTKGTIHIKWVENVGNIASRLVTNDDLNIQECGLQTIGYFGHVYLIEE